MKTFHHSLHFSKLLISCLTVIFLSSCNLFAFVDKPSGDAQLLDAARACLDRADYQCALDYYKQLSNSFIDVKISETSLTNLANKNIFKMSDLFISLGSDTGNAGSFSFLSETIAIRGKITAADRAIIQNAYADSSLITNETIRNYMQFITSLVMTNHLLASSVGADGKLTASDIVKNPSVCLRVGNVNCNRVECEKPDGSALVDSSELFPHDDADSIATQTNWETNPSIGKVIVAASAANDASNILFGGGSGGGIGEIFKKIKENPGTSDCQKRYGVLNALFSEN